MSIKEKIVNQKEIPVKDLSFRKILSMNELENAKEILLRDTKDGIKKLLELLIYQAILRKASDVHLTPHRNFLSVRYRIDGMFCPVLELPLTLTEGILIRIKVLANLTVYKRDIPQDGNIKLPDREIELRVTTFPTTHGEKAVIRILDSTKLQFTIDELGFSPEIRKRFENLISKSQGVILLTGPANSGKTTTIYASIQRILEMRKSGCNIITLEDPVEFDFGNISQTHISPFTGFTYARALSSILRQDPEVIMVGEIRDRETAKIVMEAGLTGHLILTTIHSGTSATAFIRLLEMGIEPFLLSSSISGIMAQRLVRRICLHCREEYEPAKELIQQFGINGKDTFLRGKGCNSCLGQGYSGRTAINEFLPVNNQLREMLLRKPTLSQLQIFMGENNIKTLLEDGLEKVRNGVTTLEELQRGLLVS